MRNAAAQLIEIPPSPASLAQSAFERFAMTRPKIALASENKSHFMPTTRETALRMRYVQVGGTIRWQAYMVFDVDRATAENAWRDAGLPMPTFVVTNRENGHSHVFWELSIPVSMLPVEGATRFFRAIAQAYTNRLEADARFVGLCAKNPLASTAWQVRAANVRYDLPALAKPLERRDFARPARSSGIGRNVDLFDWTRQQFAYASVREFETETAFAAAVRAFAIDKNARAFVDPLTEKECGWIAKSIAGWTWARRERFVLGRKRVRRGAMGFEPLPPVMDAARKLEAIRARQRASGPVTREAVRAATRDAITRAILTLAAEEKRVSAAAIARVSGVSVRTVMRHRDLLSGDGKVVVLQKTVPHGVLRSGEGVRDDG